MIKDRATSAGHLKDTNRRERKKKKEKRERERERERKGGKLKKKETKQTYNSPNTKKFIEWETGGRRTRRSVYQESRLVQSKSGLRLRIGLRTESRPGWRLRWVGRRWMALLPRLELRRLISAKSLKLEKKPSPLKLGK